MIEAHRITFFINDSEKFLFDFFKLHIINDHLKNGVLNANPVVAAYSCNFPQPCRTAFFCKINIIGYNLLYEPEYELYLHRLS